MKSYADWGALFKGCRLAAALPSWRKNGASKGRHHFPDPCFLLWPCSFVPWRFCAGCPFWQPSLPLPLPCYLPCVLKKPAQEFLLLLRPSRSSLNQQLLSEHHVLSVIIILYNILTVFSQLMCPHLSIDWTQEQENVSQVFITGLSLHPPAPDTVPARCSGNTE